ncbi:MAG: sarcosine oxidase subunit gamma [Rhodobacteraceae bacterium]|nr:MAG: sarcosine oxidase subunit gamma [Paracoccaceae bacterium]
MSEPVSALNHAAFTGIAEITEIGLQGMITLRGDLASVKIRKAATGVAGVDMPGQGRANCDGDRGLCWMSPDELLVLCPYDTVAADIEKMRKTLAGEFALAVDVSDARCVFDVSGSAAREVLAKLAPVDLSPAAFTPGMFRRTKLAQVPAAIWMRDDRTFRIVVFRSVAQYAFDLLKVAAQEGSEVGVF